MQLTARGAQVAQLGPREAKEVARQLMGGQKNVSEFTLGVCYDTVAFVRCLLGAAITPQELVSVSGTGWWPKFAFERGVPWDGKGAIPEGSAVGFHRTVDGRVFHARWPSAAPGSAPSTAAFSAPAGGSRWTCGAS
jgi:hypothetical protein